MLGQRSRPERRYRGQLPRSDGGTGRPSNFAISSSKEPKVSKLRTDAFRGVGCARGGTALCTGGASAGTSFATASRDAAVFLRTSAATGGAAGGVGVSADDLRAPFSKDDGGLSVNGFAAASTIS